MQRFLLAAATAITALNAPQPAAAEPVPASRTGVWIEGAGPADCAAPIRAYLVGPRHVLAFERPADILGPTGRVVFGPVAYLAGSLIMTRPPAGPDWFVVLPPFDTLHRCPSLPGMAHGLFGEAITFFELFGELQGPCMEAPDPSCALRAFAALDVSGDGRLSEAEIVRGLRALGFFLSYEIAIDGRMRDWDGASLWAVSQIPPSGLVGGSLAASFFGPMLVGNLIRSYDYDGDGFLSMAELMQDRGPMDLTSMVGTFGTQASQVALGTVLDGLSGAFRGLLPALMTGGRF